MNPFVKFDTLYILYIYVRCTKKLKDCKMATTAALLAQYMSLQNQLADAQYQQTRWNNLATAMSKKLSEQTKLEDKWETKSDAAYDDYTDPDKEIKAKGGTVIKEKGATGLRAIVLSEYKLEQKKFAEKYAYDWVPSFNRDKLEEYTMLDMEYSTMVSMYETLATELETQANYTKEATGTAAQDNGIIGS